MWSIQLVFYPLPRGGNLRNGPSYCKKGTDVSSAPAMSVSGNARWVFNSRTPQRGDASGKQPGAESPCSRDIGPGTYDPRPGAGQQCWQPWLNDPMRMGSAFASQAEKCPVPRPLTASVDHGGDFGISAKYLKQLQGDVPGSRAHSWPKGERKPPHFHVPFRAYPSLGGQPRGRSPGLDAFYDLDNAIASPVALHGTLTVNMSRTARVYASTFKSKQPSRPNPGAVGAGELLGPGSYNIDRTFLKASDKPNSAFIRYSGGKFRNVGGPRGDGGLWPEDEVGRKPRRKAGRGSSAKPAA